MQQLPPGKARETTSTLRVLPAKKVFFSLAWIHFLSFDLQPATSLRDVTAWSFLDLTAPVMIRANCHMIFFNLNSPI